MLKRLTKPVLGFLGISLGANGAFMLLVPDLWFHGLPGVVDTGPFNMHLVRDVGAAYLSASAAILLAMKYPLAGFPLLLVASTFLGLHGVVHLWDSFAGRLSWHHLANDTPTVIFPALITLLFALNMRAPAQETKS